MKFNSLERKNINILIRNNIIGTFFFILTYSILFVYPNLFIPKGGGFLAGFENRIIFFVVLSILMPTLFFIIKKKPESLIKDFFFFLLSYFYLVILYIIYIFLEKVDYELFLLLIISVVILTLISTMVVFIKKYI